MSALSNHHDIFFFVSRQNWLHDVIRLEKVLLIYMDRHTHTHTRIMMFLKQQVSGNIIDFPANLCELVVYVKCSLIWKEILTLWIFFTKCSFHTRRFAAAGRIRNFLCLKSDFGYGCLWKKDTRQKMFISSSYLPALINSDKCSLGSRSVRRLETTLSSVWSKNSPTMFRGNLFCIDAFLRTRISSSKLLQKLCGRKGERRRCQVNLSFHSLTFLGKFFA